MNGYQLETTLTTIAKQRAIEHERDQLPCATCVTSVQGVLLRGQQCRRQLDLHIQGSVASTTRWAAAGKSGRAQSSWRCEESPPYG